MGLIKLIIKLLVLPLIVAVTWYNGSVSSSRSFRPLSSICLPG